MELDRNTSPTAAGLSGEALAEEELSLHERVVQRDESALLQCFDRIGHLVYCVALSCTESHESAEELTEEMFVGYWQHPHDFPPARGPLSLQLIRRITTDLAVPSHT